MGTKDNEIDSIYPDTFNKLLYECNAMLYFSLSSGYYISSAIFENLINIEVEHKRVKSAGKSKNVGFVYITKLVEIHSLLVQTIKPCTPRAAILMKETTKNPQKVNMFRSVRIYRNMLTVVIFSLLTFILFGVSPEINMETRAKYIFLELSGFSLLKILIFLMSAASLGASLACALIISYHLEKGTFDPIYASSYWIKYLFGMVFGLLSCTLFVHAISIDSDTFHEAGRPASAMLGGFSSHLFFLLVKVLIDMMESTKIKFLKIKND
ncbi:hypothetical protein [Microbulbifer sp. GL-2]|uniref:hypothetical protein n=1 Tax=Microbulbifer sp. GL-2 TaxID=2591606 RepID=UPI0011629756|nr:hypothetical protein [Microbulbifer sp. GL-2]BBM02891.1 hypothetical protein GL2_29650 [Microbulbifer sp. GL-2]